jgi:hypothetical protein
VCLLGRPIVEVHSGPEARSSACGQKLAADTHGSSVVSAFPVTKQKRLTSRIKGPSVHVKLV